MCYSLSLLQASIARFLLISSLHRYAGIPVAVALSRSLSQKFVYKLFTGSPGRDFVGHKCIHCPPHPVFHYTSLPCASLCCSGPLLIFAPWKLLSRSKPRTSASVLVKSPVGNHHGSSMAFLSFARSFFSLVCSGTLFMDSQKLLQLWSLACLTTHLYEC